MKICPLCKAAYPATTEYFYKNYLRKDGSIGFSLCKSCSKSDGAERYRRKRETRPCRIDGCKNGVHNGEYCATHDRRRRLYGDPLGVSERTKKHGKGFIDIRGYRRFGNRAHKGSVLEHRRIMEHHLGRPLMANENVHHINGNRSDNRLENLELWVKSQPCGQRASDLVIWAHEIISLYGQLFALNPIFKAHEKTQTAEAETYEA